MMLKRLLIISSLIFCFQNQLCAQGEPNWWLFGSNAGVDFNSGAPVSVNGGQVVTTEGCTSISDLNGNLLFYSDGITVWDKNHNQMPNGFGLDGDPSSTQSGLIVRQPGGTNIYWIFTTPASCSGAFEYSLVDMTLNGGNGDVTLKNQFLYGQTAEKICGIVADNCIDVWVITHGCNNNSLHAYLLTAAGLGAPVISNVGSVITGIGDEIGYLRGSNDGYWLCMAMRYNYSSELFNFDKLTGVITGPIVNIPNVNGARPYGVEFSPNCQVLYITANLSASGGLFQYDLSSGNGAAILASEQWISPNDQIYAIQAMTDGKIYGAVYTSNYMCVINSPDVLGVGCGFVQNAVDLTPNSNTLGLPGIINTLYVPCTAFILDSLFCFGDATQFWLNDTAGIPSVIWDFGDPNSGVNNSSNSFFPTHTFSVADTFQVSAIFSFAGILDTAFATVIILPLPVVNLGADTVLCPGATLMLDATNPNANYLWQDGSTDSTYLVIQAGTYYAEVTVGACSNSDTIDVIYDLPLPVDLGNDTTVCAGEFVLIDGTTAGAISYLWQDNSTNSTYFTSAPGTYWVIVSDSFCSYADTMTLSNFNPLVLDFGNDTTICENASLLLDASNPNATYLWQDGSTDSTFLVTLAGNYSVVVSANGCTIGDSINVDIDLLPIVDIGNDTMLCFGSYVLLDAGNPGSSYWWSSGSYEQTVSVSHEDLYIVNVTNDCGTASDSLQVLNQICGCELYIPNAFTPNGDGLNDLFLSHFGNCTFENYYCKVFNRWGELVFTSSDVAQGWNGDHASIPSEVGVYVYLISYAGTYEGVTNTYLRKGNVTLIR